MLFLGSHQVNLRKISKESWPRRSISETSKKFYSLLFSFVFFLSAWTHCSELWTPAFCCLLLSVTQKLGEDLHLCYYLFLSKPSKTFKAWEISLYLEKSKDSLDTVSEIGLWSFFINGLFFINDRYFAPYWSLSVLCWFL